MQKNNRKCHQISRAKTNCDPAGRPRSSESHQRGNGRWSVHNYETSHYSKEEDNSSYLPNLAKKHKRRRSRRAELPLVSIRAYPICTATCHSSVRSRPFPYV